MKQGCSILVIRLAASSNYRAIKIDIHAVASELLTNRLSPLLVTYGAKDLLLQPTMSTRMQALNQEAQISLYPESAHAPFYDEPDRFSRELAAFIRDRQSSAG